MGPDTPFNNNYPYGNPYYYGPIFDPGNNKIGFLGWFNGKYGSIYLENPNYLDGRQYDGKMWNLRSVTYPTDGYIEFDYESNNYYVDFSYLGSANTLHFFDINDDMRKVWGAGSRLVSQWILTGAGSYYYTYTYGSTLCDGQFIPSLGRMYCDPIGYNASFPSTQSIVPPISSENTTWQFHQATHQVLYQQVD